MDYHYKYQVLPHTHKKKKPHLYYAIRKFREERLFIKGDNGSKLSLYPLINAKSIY